MWRVVLLLLVACDRGPSDEELDRRRTEASTANRARLEADETNAAAFSLSVDGQVGKPGAVLTTSEVKNLATTTVETIDAQNPDRAKPTKFRGVLVRELLERFAVPPTVEEMTFVSRDGFRATVKTADARAYRMLLAIEADGAPIPAARGGPIYLVHPWSESPQIRDVYVDRFWAFYVTHVVFGTEPEVLYVGDRRVEVDNLEQRAWDDHVGFKVEWPAEVVHLRGAYLTDALAAVGLAVPANGRVIVHGKAHAFDDPMNPVAFDADALARCKPLLATRWGPDEAPIPARLGGPIVLALSPCGSGERSWVTFVERIEVVAP